MRVVVIGGRGHLGRATAQGLARRGHEVATAGRSASSDLQLDVADPKTWSVLPPTASSEAFDAIVNVSDVVASPPDALVRHAVAQGFCFVETGADPVLYRRLLSEGPESGRPEGPGCALLGAGVFPGLSNLLVAAAASDDDCQSVDLGIRWSPFSGAGAGTVRLMTHLLDVPTHRRRGGTIESGPPLAAGPSLPFSDGLRRSLEIPLCEPDLFVGHALPELRSFASFVPDLVMTSFRLTPSWLLRSSLMQTLMFIQFSVLRRFILGGVSSRVRMAARATSSSGVCTNWSLDLRDGMATGGDVAALMTEAFVGMQTKPDAYCMPWQVAPLDDVTTALGIEVDVRRDGVQP